MGLEFKCCLVNEVGHSLRIKIPQSSPAWMDMLNTLCGANPEEWIGHNSHDKVFKVTPSLKNSVFEICTRDKSESQKLGLIAQFFQEQPDDCFISFLRVDALSILTDERIKEARLRALVANYMSDMKCANLDSRADKQTKVGSQTLFCLISDGTSWKSTFHLNFPNERLCQIVNLLHVATDMSLPTMRNGNNFWRLSELRKHINSNEVTASLVSGQINSYVNRLKGNSDSDIVVFGILENADITQLTDMKLACMQAKLDGSHIPFYDQRMANDRLFYIGGYTRRSYTDLGFDYSIKGEDTCRFCGRDHADGATFNKEAHAISYFWGNHSLLGAGECDDCNAFFGETLEKDALRYYLPTMISCGMTGRGQNPQALGENFHIKKGETRILADENDTNVYERLQRGEAVPQELNDSRPVVKSNIYRCFCKYVISLINDEELVGFKETIRWIMKKRRSGKYLPPILRNEKDFSAIQTPIIDIFTSNSLEAAHHSYIISFRFLTNLWLFTVPYIKGIDSSQLTKELLSFQKNYYPDIDFVNESFSDERKTYTTTHLSLSVKNKSKIKRFCDMTPEEQKDFNRSIPKNWRK